MQFSYKSIFTLLMPLAVVTWSCPVFSSSFWEVSAHRGDRGTYRENSISALIHAMDIGAASVEFDVHLTKDGVPIIYHDYKLNPADFVGLTEPVLIKDLTLSQIKSIPYSDRLVTKATDQRLVTFKEFLLAVKYRESRGQTTIPLHLEIKSEKKFIDQSAPIDKLASSIAEVINQVDLKTKIIARAFNWDVLTEFRKHHPDIARVLLVDKGQWSEIDFEKAIKDFSPIAFAPNFADLTPDSISFLTKRGIDVNP